MAKVDSICTTRRSLIVGALVLGLTPACRQTLVYAPQAARSPNPTEDLKEVLNGSQRPPALIEVTPKWLKAVWTYGSTETLMFRNLSAMELFSKFGRYYVKVT